MKKILSILVLASALFLMNLTGCTPRGMLSLNVSAAPVLSLVLKEVNGLYSELNPNIAIVENFGASGTLQKQIENGAPADVFVSAAAVYMDNLQNQNLILNETRRDLLRNRLVLIVPGDSTLGISSFKDLINERVKKVAIGDPRSVSAGTYGQQVFDELGITTQIRSKLILAGDVRQVLSYVESGNVDAGIVFYTDAKSSTGVKVVASAPDDINARVVYPVAVIRASRNPDNAKDYVNFLFSTQARGAFEKYGFSMASK